MLAPKRCALPQQTHWNGYVIDDWKPDSRRTRQADTGTLPTGASLGGGTDPRKTTALSCRPFTWRFQLTFLPALSRKPYKNTGFVDRASNRLPGGERKNSRVCAASSCANFRVAALTIAENLLHLPVSNGEAPGARTEVATATSISNHPFRPREPEPLPHPSAALNTPAPRLR
jgi:hypothetical protein